MHHVHKKDIIWQIAEFFPGVQNQTGTHRGNQHFNGVDLHVCVFHIAHVGRIHLILANYNMG